MAKADWMEEFPYSTVKYEIRSIEWVGDVGVKRQWNEMIGVWQQMCVGVLVSQRKWVWAHDIDGGIPHLPPKTPTRLDSTRPNSPLHHTSFNSTLLIILL